VSTQRKIPNWATNKKRRKVGELNIAKEKKGPERKRNQEGWKKNPNKKNKTYKGRAFAGKSGKADGKKWRGQSIAKK